MFVFSNVFSLNVLLVLLVLLSVMWQSILFRAHFYFFFCASNAVWVKMWHWLCCQCLFSNMWCFFSEVGISHKTINFSDIWKSFHTVTMYIVVLLWLASNITQLFPNPELIQNFFCHFKCQLSPQPMVNSSKKEPIRINSSAF